jgi:N-acetylglucosamine-6-phosphate deacetylase
VPNYVVTCKQILAPHPIAETRLWLANGEILAVGDWSGDTADFEPLDFTDFTCSPGLIDLQVNGSPDCNFWADPSPQNLTTLRLELARCGVTSFLPTLITAPLSKLIQDSRFSQGSRCWTK